MEKFPRSIEKKEIPLKVLIIIFFVSLSVIIGLFLFLSDNLPFSESIQEGVVTDKGNESIAGNQLDAIRTKEVGRCSELDLKKDEFLLLNDFENSNTQNACEMELVREESQISKTISKDDGICDAYLRIKYHFISCPATSIEVKCAKKIKLKDYKDINFLVRLTDQSTEVQSGFFDESDSAYSKIISDGSGLKNKNKWYLVTIQLDELYNPRISPEKKVLEKKTLNNDLLGYLFRIGFPMTGECQEKEYTIDLDTVYLSKS